MVRTVAALLLAASAACGPADERLADAASETPDAAALPDAAAPRANLPGKHLHTLVVDGLAREVIVYVPERAAGATAAPVVLMFHGTSGDGERFYAISGWREKSDAVGLISVYPTALVHCFHEDENRDGDTDDPGELKVTTKWSHGKLGADLPLCTAEEIAGLPPDRRALADHPLADDVAFTRALLELLEHGYAVDARRVYATGFSNGGGFTSRLAVELSDRFAAIAASGGVLQVDSVASRAIPVAFTVGALDDRFTVPLGVAALPLSESILDLPGWAAVTVAPYLASLRLDDQHGFAEVTLAGGVRAARFEWTSSALGAPNQYVQLVIDDLRHQYANGDNHPVVYADLFWAFFEPHRL